jgi:hypothetical protein
MDQARGIRLDQGKIGGRVDADKPRPQDLAVGKPGIHLTCLGDHVVVGEDVSVRGDDNPRAGGGGKGAALLNADGDADYGRRNLFNDAGNRPGIGIEYLDVGR